MLQNDDIKLRALEPEDLDWLFNLENDTKLWEVSQTIAPFSKSILRNYIDNAQENIYTAGQLRMVITDLNTRQNIGLIDLYDFDSRNKKAGVGIVILPEFQKQYYASKALQIIVGYAFTHLDLHQLFAYILSDNIKSIKLFEKNNFVLSGTKIDWVFSNGQYKNQHIYQLIRNEHS